MGDTLIMAASRPTIAMKIRRKSIEDYQKQIIDKIKNHFQRNREEWEMNLQRKIHPEPVAKVEQEIGCRNCQQSQTRTSNMDLKVGNLPSRSPSVRILSCQIINKTTQEKTMQLEVDISEFLPDEEVTFKPEKNGLAVCAKFTGSMFDKQSIEKVKFIPVKGLVETERIKIRPTSNGSVILELKVLSS